MPHGRLRGNCGANAAAGSNSAESRNGARALRRGMLERGGATGLTPGFPRGYVAAIPRKTGVEER